MTGRTVRSVVFDLGGVLIDWDPRYLYRTIFADEAAMEDFLTTITTAEWNRAQDAGRPWSEAVDELVARHPERREQIEAYWRRWPETLGEPIGPTVGLEAGETVFIDDQPTNVDAARAVGLVGIQFVDAPRLRAELASLGVLGDPSRFSRR